jgi:hypothetical protein
MAAIARVALMLAATWRPGRGPGRRAHVGVPAHPAAWPPVLGWTSGGIGWGGLEGLDHDRFDHVVTDPAGGAGPPGVPDVDTSVANHLVKTVDASRLMGASVIITGLSSEIAQTLVTIGVDLSKMNTIGDLQGGIEEAERLLGFRVTRSEQG